VGWTGDNKLYLTGSITSGLTLSPTNADGGTIPVGMSISTYDDYTYDDSTYERTAIYEGLLESSYTVSRITWVSSGDSNDIKYQVNESEDGIVFEGWSAEADAIETTTYKTKRPYIKFRFLFYSHNWSDSDSVQVTQVDRAFTAYVNGNIIDANEFNENFYTVGRDDLLPRGGTDLAGTTGVYNIGSSAYEWKAIHVNNLITDDYIRQTYNLIAKTVLSATATRIEFTGLSDDQYYITCKFIMNTTTTTDKTLMFFNGDSAANYGYMIMKSDSLGAFFVIKTERKTTQTGIFIGEALQTNTISDEYGGLFRGYINTHAGHEKMVIGDGMAGAFSSTTTGTVETIFSIGGIWSNNSDTVTSIQIIQASKLNANTEVKLWVRK